MAVSLSGSVFASLSYEHNHVSCDQEGFLLGHAFSHVKDTISDSQINKREEEAVLYITGFLPYKGTYNWYDSAGKIDQKKIHTILKKQNSKEIIGWYKFRRNSTLRPSLRETNIHSKLQYAFQNVPSDRFIFALFTSSKTTNSSTYSFDYLFHHCQASILKPVKVNIVNLGDTSHDMYRKHPNMIVDMAATNYFTDALENYRMDFFHKQSGTLQQVFALNNMDSQLQSKLMDLAEEVSASESEVRQLQKEMEAMERRCKQISPSLLAMQVPLPLPDDPFAKAPFPAKKKYPLPKQTHSLLSHEMPKLKTATKNSYSLHEDLMDLNIEPTTQTVEVLKPLPSHTSRTSMKTDSDSLINTSNETLSAYKSSVARPAVNLSQSHVQVNAAVSKKDVAFGFVSEMLKTPTVPLDKTQTVPHKLISNSDTVHVSYADPRALDSSASGNDVNTRVDGELKFKKYKEVELSSDSEDEVVMLSSSPVF